jgi:hypothetical protein
MVAHLKLLVIDLKARQGNKGQAMFLKHPEEKNLKPITLDEFKIQLMELVLKNVQPERLNPEDANSVCDSPTTENKENP